MRSPDAADRDLPLPMGNKIGRRRQAVDDKYTRPQGLYQHRDIDHKKLRKLILDAKLAPCYLGEEDCAIDLEECPICFLYYPSLNRSRCCMKGICTECFLQMKPPNSTRPTQCPFCKTSNYAVEYRGMRTKEEKGIEQIEEQKVIEAKIRMWQQELQDEEVRMQKKQETSSSNRTVTPAVAEYQGTTNSPLAVASCKYSTIHGDGLGHSQLPLSPPLSRSPSRSRQNRTIALCGLGVAVGCGGDGGDTLIFRLMILADFNESVISINIKLF